jgi:hypothetical protein
MHLLGLKGIALEGFKQFSMSNYDDGMTKAKFAFSDNSIHQANHELIGFLGDDFDWHYLFISKLIISEFL